MNPDKKTYDVDKHNLPAVINQLYYHRIDVRIAASGDTVWDAWPGAILRNNLLSAADQVIIAGNISLREQIDKCPLNKDHPMFKDLIQGFPKGYLIALPDVSLGEKHLKKGALFCFSLYLVGHMSTYFSEFIQAIRIMCLRGMGHPQVPFYMVDICEKALDGRQHLLSIGSDNLADALTFPVTFLDFQPEKASREKTCIEIVYLTPVILFKQTDKKDISISYQAKSNGFPSFYQLVRSTANRMTKLALIYTCPEKTEVDDCSEKALNSWIDYATNPSLIAIDMQKLKLKNTLKKEGKNKMPLSGYVGKQTYEGYFNRYLPMLKFMEALGVGNETVYGMGRYRVRLGQMDKIK